MAQPQAQLLFEQIAIPQGANTFTGVFLTQECYRDLLALADSYYGLGMLSSQRKLPCATYSYMLVSKGHAGAWLNVGLKVSLVIDRLMYHEKHGVVAAIVQLKKNFTCNGTPHIILAKRHGLTSATAHNIVHMACTQDSGAATFVTLERPYRAHGRIGTLVGSNEEESAFEVVDRPEVAHSVELARPRPPAPPQPAETMEIIVGTTSSTRSDTKKSEPVSTGEFYKGCPVMKGPRGGKYITKDGKKVYIKEGASLADASGNGGDQVLYKVSILN